MKPLPDTAPTAENLHKILQQLRAPDGCPWDRAQTRATLGSCLEGECAELLDAIAAEDPENIREEIGDVLMNLLLQVAVAEEKGEFTLADMLSEIIAKMIRRHPHVFGEYSATDPEQVRELWGKIKAREKNHAPRESVFDGVPHSLSALSRAAKLQKRAAKTGFDWTDAPQILDKVAEELGELRAAKDDAETEEEIGDLLFAAVNYARFLDKDPELLLRRANEKFVRRFSYIEKTLRAEGTTPSEAGTERMETLWNEAKAQEHAKR